MQRIDVVFRPEAVDDLNQIYRFIRDISHDRTIARGYVQRIRERCLRIGNVPFGGTARDDLEPGIRTVAFERRAVIAYRIVEYRIEIMNIFYGGRDLDAIYRGREDDLE